MSNYNLKVSNHAGGYEIHTFEVEPPQRCATHNNQILKQQLERQRAHEKAMAEHDRLWEETSKPVKPNKTYRPACEICERAKQAKKTEAAYERNAKFLLEYLICGTLPANRIMAEQVIEHIYVTKTNKVVPTGTSFCTSKISSLTEFELYSCLIKLLSQTGLCKGSLALTLICGLSELCGVTDE